MKKVDFERVFKAILFFLGVFFFLYLAHTLPIWHDEAFSIWASKTSFLELLSWRVDPVHPPGYYLFLKFWSLPSDHLFWLRMSSIFFFAINLFFLDKIGTKIKGPFFSLCLIFLYIFSGYFVIFNWQVRMYTGVTAFILASLFFLLNRNLLLFTLVNAIGLYFDYGFFWYFIPLFFLLLIRAIFKKSLQNKELFLSALTSTVVFLVWLPFFLENYKLGIEGIGWVKPFLSFSFSLPFFLGTHNNEIFTILFFLIAIFGLYLFWQKNRQKKVIRVILFSAAFSFFSTVVFSVLFFPVFHPRSLQIVGLGVIFLFALTIDWLYQKKQKFLAFFVFLLILVNFFFTLNLFFSEKSGRLLLSFFPWKQLKTEVEAGNFSYVAFKKTKRLPTELLVWGLKYTLDGKESLPIRKIPYINISSTPFTKMEECELISDNLLAIYGCK